MDWEDSEGWPAVLQCKQSLWDCPLQPPRQVRGGSIECILLLAVPRDVWPGQGDLAGPWEDTAKALVTAGKDGC